jgi:hypothetical protein
MDLSAQIAVGQNTAILTGEGLAQLRALYPLCAGKLAHSLSGHPLFEPAVLALLAERMDPALVECRAAQNRNGEGFAMAEPTAGSAAETIRQIDTAGRWIMLRNAETLPEFAELLAMLMGEIGPVVRSHTGEPLVPHAFVFVSSPGTLTPFHFDPEFNILFQIAGTKRFATCPASAPWLDAEAQEKFHTSGDNLLPWQLLLGQSASIHELAPGDAVFVPYKAPHWVEAGAEPSISLSLTWRSAASLAQDDVWRLRSWLQRRGVDAAPPPPLPHDPWLRAKAMRMLDRLGLS